MEYLEEGETEKDQGNIKSKTVRRRDEFSSLLLGDS